MPPLPRRPSSLVQGRGTFPHLYNVGFQGWAASSVETSLLFDHRTEHQSLIRCWELASPIERISNQYFSSLPRTHSHFSNFLACRLPEVWPHHSVSTKPIDLMGQGLIKKLFLWWNPTLLCRINNGSPLDSILGQMKPVYTLTPCFFNIHFNIILSSSSRSFEWFSTGCPTKIYSSSISPSFNSSYFSYLMKNSLYVIASFS